jgi:hypothetical protein
MMKKKHGNRCEFCPHLLHARVSGRGNRRFENVFPETQFFYILEL